MSYDIQSTQDIEITRTVSIDTYPAHLESARDVYIMGSANLIAFESKVLGSANVRIMRLDGTWVDISIATVMI